MPKEFNKDEKRLIEIGLKIAYYRKMNGMTQEQLAERVGIATKYLSHLETPSRAQQISLLTLFAIADALNVPPRKFFDFDME